MLSSKFIFTFLLLFYQKVISCIQKPSFCVNCKYILPEIGRNAFNHIQYSKCLLYPIRKRDNYYLVTGKDNHSTSNDMQSLIDLTVDYDYCINVRKDEKKCGTKGIYYENEN